MSILTYVNYERYLNTKINPYIGEIKLSKIRPHTIVKLYDSLIAEGYIRNGKRCEYQYITLKRVQDVLNGIFKTAVQWEIMARNPCDVVKTPKVGKGKEKIKYLDERQIRLFLGALDQEYKAVFRAHDRIDDTGKQYHVDSYTMTYKLPLQYTKIVPFAGNFNIGEVTGPNQIWRFLCELLLKVVGIFTIIAVLVIAKGFFCGHLGEIKAFHQAVHSADADQHAIITLKNICDLVSTKSFVAISIDLKNHLTDFLIFFGAVSRFRTKMLVIGASVNT